MGVITKKNFYEASVGAFSSMFLFLSLKVGDTFTINPVMGALITLVWSFILYQGLKIHKEEFWFDFVVTFVIAAGLSLSLGLIDQQTLFSLEVFGTVVAPALWSALPTAVIFDKFNITNYFVTQFRGR